MKHKARVNVMLVALINYQSLTIRMHKTSKYAGQIIRIYMENFMSYDNIEIYPGDHLNLIIGPNGTGKSSIVCAVLLGLGGKLKTLGRGDQLSSYVKSGCDQSLIEIELYEPRGCNVVIRRIILLNNQSEFMVNGKVSNATKVSEIRKKYNIQIDNLCTFLPQEKVQDFAKLNHQELLDHTQRTVGNGALVQLQDDLKKLRLKTVDQEKHNYFLQDELDNEKQKNERLKDKIKCLKERQSLCDKLVVLNQKKAWLHYMEENEAKMEIERDTNLAKKAYQEKKQEVEKCQKALVDFEKNLSCYQQKLNEAKRDEAGKRVVVDDWTKRAERRVDELEDLRDAMQAEKDKEESKKKEMLKYKENVEKLTNDLKTLDSNVGSEAELCAKRREADDRLKEIHSEEARLNKVKVDLEEDEDTLKHELRNTLVERQNLEKRKNIRLEYLKRHEPDVYKSKEWLEKNRHLFQSRIYDPMLLELDVPNSKMAKFVEMRLSYKDLISFTCTNPDDLNLLIKKLRTEQKLKVNAICSDNYQNSQYTPKIPISSLRCYGFYAYLKDLITGPEDIIRYLCKTYRIHCIPVGNEKVKVNCEKVPKDMPVFYSENHAFIAKYSAYSGDKSLEVKKLNQPKIFSQSVDQGRIQILMEREKNLEKKIKNKQIEIRDVESQLNQFRKESDEVKLRKRQLGTSAEEREQIQTNLKKAMDRYSSIKGTLRGNNEIEKEIDSKRQVLMKKIRTNLEDLKGAIEASEKTVFNRQKCELQFKMSRFGSKKILENKERYNKELKRAEELLTNMKERLKTAERQCLQLKEKAKNLTNCISIEEKEFGKFKKKFEPLPDCLNDIEAEIQETRAKADYLQGGNLKILEDYEKREEKIIQLTVSLENSKKSLEEKKSELSSKRDQWLQPVNELVSSINVNFKKFFKAMGCVGEVHLVSGDDQNNFEEYGIEILVSFRDGAPLQQLGRYFQSGGERAVATAIFMLSLQELTSVPFRFVDEINQGMDPENERRILQLIVRVTSPEHSAQYFFITPKLLSDIEYLETMTVLCIYKGPNAISSSEWNLQKFLEHSTHSDENDED